MQVFPRGSRVLALPSLDPHVSAHHEAMLSADSQSERKTDLPSRSGTDLPREPIGRGNRLAAANRLPVHRRGDHRNGKSGYKAQMAI
jgi:hypothetical protein